MKIIVTAVSSSIDSKFDPRFGRCADFIVIDPETMQWESFPNTGIDAPGGAGAVAAQFSAEQMVDAVISGDFGPTASLALNAAGISMHLNRDDGSIGEVIDRFKAGDLQQFKI